MKTGTICRSIERGMKAIILEGRIPGAVFSKYYSIMNYFGVKEIFVHENNITSKVLTNNFGIYYEVFRKRVYDHEGYSFCPGQIVIDVGANAGYFSLYAASAGAHVIAVEPCSENLDILNWNISRNTFGDRVRVLNAAVTRVAGPIDFYVGIDNRGQILSGSASVCNANRGGVTSIKRSVDGITLDRIFDIMDIERCDFLKVDCEGGEYEILKGTSPHTFDKIARISMETHSGRGDEAVKMLQQAGFEILSFENGEAGMLKAQAKNLPSRTFGAG